MQQTANITTQGHTKTTDTESLTKCARLLDKY